MNIYIYKSEDEVSDHLSNYIIDNFIDNKNIALSGGSTPIKLFKVLAKKLINYKKINSKFYWIDERCVSIHDDESNYKSANDNLLSKINIEIKNIYKIDGDIDPKISSKNYSTLLNNNLPHINNLPSLDLSILGIGDDGHTASIFPHDMKKFQDYNECFIATHPISKQKRISLSKNIINNSKEIIFHVTGSKKSIIIDEIINEYNDHLSYPASHIKPNDGKISWYLDNDAAKNLTKNK